MTAPQTERPWPSIPVPPHSRRPCTTATATDYWTCTSIGRPETRTPRWMPSPAASRGNGLSRPRWVHRVVHGGPHHDVADPRRRHAARRPARGHRIRAPAPTHRHRQHHRGPPPVAGAASPSLLRHHVPPHHAGRGTTVAAARRRRRHRSAALRIPRPVDAARRRRRARPRSRCGGSPRRRLQRHRRPRRPLTAHLDVVYPTGGLPSSSRAGDLDPEIVLFPARPGAQHRRRQEPAPAPVRNRRHRPDRTQRRGHHPGGQPR